MQIYPAIDLKNGQCVRLYQGSYDQVTIYENDPLKTAVSFAEQGAEFIHIVDLDGAKQGHSVNLSIIEQIARETDLTVQTGGGIRSEQQVTDLLAAGISRVVLGSIAAKEIATVKKWLDQYGADKIVLALDIRFDDAGVPRLAVHGWQTATEKSLWDILDDYQSSALHVLCTDIALDGTLQGPNVKLYQACVDRYPQLQFQASGGISCLNDLTQLAKVPVASVIIGKALYENKFSLRSALEYA